MTKNIVSIDGPSASGKSSVSRELARQLGWKWVSTGAFYRALAYVAMQEGIVSDNLPELIRLTQSASWSVQLDADLTRVFYQGQDVSAAVFSEQNGSRASVISQLPRVREALLVNQQDCAKGVAGLVAEGRDCGTVVFPEAILKVYLTASQEERALRRSLQQGLDFIETQSQQTLRDQQDSNRTAAPLQVPKGARVINSSGMDLSQVVAQIYLWVDEALKAGSTK